MRAIHLLTLLFLFGCAKKKADDTTTPLVFVSPEYRGADMSLLPEVRSFGYTSTNPNSSKEDMLVTLKNAGVNLIRLRLWYAPTEATCGFESVRKLADEAHQMGFKVMLTIHYSDTWADPANQTKPDAWKQLNITQLNDSIYQYTKRIMLQMHPEFIAIGNEVNQGFLWPEGSISSLSNFKLLFSSAASAVREVDSTARIVLHYAGLAGAESFYQQLKSLDYDVAGLSYYPWWHGKSLDSVSIVLSHLILNNNKEAMIVETSYPFTLQWNDQTNNIIGWTTQLIPNYPATQEGQYLFLKTIREITGGTGKGCLGFCYWGGEWVSYKSSSSTNGSTWENQALWGFDGVAVKAMGLFGR